MQQFDCCGNNQSLLAFLDRFVVSSVLCKGNTTCVQGNGFELSLCAWKMIEKSETSGW